MAEQESIWTAERAEKHERWNSRASWLLYRPFARRVARTLPAPLGELQVLDLGQRRARAAGLSRYSTRIGRAEELPLDSASIDLVVSQFSFHEWSDPQKGLREALRVIKAGGSLVLRDFTRGRFTSLLAPSRRRHQRRDRRAARGNDR